MDTTQRLELLTVLDYVLSNPSKLRSSTKKTQYGNRGGRTRFLKGKESDQGSDVDTNKVEKSIVLENDRLSMNGWVGDEDGPSQLSEILSTLSKNKRQNGKASERQKAKTRQGSGVLQARMLNCTESSSSTSKTFSTSNYSELEDSLLYPLADIKTCDLKDGSVYNFKHDEALLELAYELRCDWQKIAKCFPEQNVSSKFLKDRYKTLNDVILPNKARFTPMEDRKILKYYDKFGMNWAAIASMLPGRGAITIKNRFYSSLRNKVKKDSFDEEVEESCSITSVQEKATAPSLSLSKNCSMNIEEIETKTEQDEKEKWIRYSSLEVIQYDLSESRQYNDCDHFFSFNDNLTSSEALKGEEAKFIDQQNAPNVDFSHFKTNINPDLLNFGENKNDNYLQNIEEMHHENEEFGQINNKINRLMSLYHEICQDLNYTKNKMQD